MTETVPLHLADHAVIGVFLAAMVAIGLAFRRRAGSGTGEFFSSGRSLPWWLAGVSMVATSFGADAPLFVTGLVREGGVSANWIWWAFLVGHVLAVFFFAGLWRRAGVTTDVELCELRYGPRGGAVLRGVKAVYAGIVLNGAALVWVLVAAKKIGGLVLGFDETLVLIGCIVIAGGYAVTSGLWGVVWTDLLQFVFAIGGSVALAVAGVEAAGGLEAVKQGALETLGPDGLTLWPIGGPSGWEWTPAAAGFVVSVGLLSWTNKNVDGGGALVQRMAASRSPKDAVLATGTFCVLHYGLRSWPWIVCGLASLVLLPVAGTPHPDLAGLAPAVADDPEAAYVALITLLPAGLRGVVVAALLAAFISTVDTFINLSSAYLVEDGYRRFIRTDASEGHYVLVARVVGVSLTVVAAAIALYTDSILAVFMLLLTFTSGVGIVYLARWLWWRTNVWSEVAALGSAGLVGLLLAWSRADGPDLALLAPAHAALGTAFESWRTTWQLPAGPFGIVAVPCISLPIWLGLTWATPPVDRETLETFHETVRPPGFWGPLRTEGTAPPRSLPKLASGWAAGVLLGLSTLAAPGAFLFGRPVRGLAWVAAGLAATLWIGWAFHRTGWEDVV